MLSTPHHNAKHPLHFVAQVHRNMKHSGERKTTFESEVGGAIDYAVRTGKIGSSEAHALKERLSIDRQRVRVFIYTYTKVYVWICICMCTILYNIYIYI